MQAVDGKQEIKWSCHIYQVLNTESQWSPVYNKSILHVANYIQTQAHIHTAIVSYTQVGLGNISVFADQY